jgi:hypothetical protein
MDFCHAAQGRASNHKMWVKIAKFGRFYGGNGVKWRSKKSSVFFKIFVDKSTSGAILLSSEGVPNREQPFLAEVIHRRIR